jgi:ABC-type uncharacterized transport system YnjBCD substrate-binding protein
MSKTSRKLLAVICSMLLSFTFASCTKPQTTGPSKQVAINFATAGDSNMVEFFNNKIIPEFNKEFPDIKVSLVGTGAGDSGSKNIYTKIRAQLDAGKDKWDMDAACVNQSVMRDLIADGLISKFVPKTSNAKYVNIPEAKNSLGTPVTDYVIPLFKSQTVIAYNPSMVSNPPKTMEEIVSWTKANPKKFGYNGVKGGMSGVAFTTAYLYWKTGKYELFSKGVYDQANEADWAGIMKELKSLPVTYTQGNAGTLDMLNRGEIAMGPVWVDMLLLWKSEGRMDPNIKMMLPEPGMPGQPMYLVVSEKAANYDAAVKFCDFIARPEIQAKYVVEANTWYPGIDAAAVFEKCTDAAKKKLFGEVTAEELSKKGLALPLAPYMADLLRVYEEVR